MPLIDRQFLLLPILILPGSDSHHPISLIIIQVENQIFLKYKDTKIKWLKSLPNAVTENVMSIKQCGDIDCRHLNTFLTPGEFHELFIV